jgi:hypothetical protein
MQEFINRKGMKCRIYLSKTEYAHGIIKDVIISDETYTKYVDKYSDINQTYNRVHVVVDYVNKEFELREVDKFFEKSEREDFYITTSFKGKPKIITRYIN